MTVWLWAD